MDSRIILHPEICNRINRLQFSGPTTYSILQRQMSRRLRQSKLDMLSTDAPALIATANVGCQLHLQSGAQIPVLHWIEPLDK